MPHGTWQTTGHGDGLSRVVVIAAVVLGAFAVSGAVAGAAFALGQIIMLAVIALIALAAGAGVAVLVMRLQGRRRSRPAQAVALWRDNPEAIPARPRRAITPPPVINVNIGPEAAAALLDAALAARLAHQPQIRGTTEGK